ARPIILHGRQGTCWQPHVKGLTTMVNSIYNGWRMEDVWLDNSTKPQGHESGARSDEPLSDRPRSRREYRSDRRLTRGYPIRARHEMSPTLRNPATPRSIRQAPQLG